MRPFVLALLGPGSTHLDGDRICCSTQSMAVYWLRLRADLRQSRASFVALMLLVGITVGVAMAATAGAYRTATVVDRLRVANEVYDVNLNPITTVPEEVWTRVDALPQVVRTARIVGQVGLPVKADGSLDERWLSAIDVALLNRDYLREFDRPRLVSGRLPEQGGEAVINSRAASQLNLHVGDRVSMAWFNVSDTNQGLPPLSKATRGVITVVGIIVSFDDALKDPLDTTLLPIVAYWPLSGTPLVEEPYELRAYWLRHGSADVASFVAAAQNIGGSEAFAIQDSQTATTRANRSLLPYALALAVFALLVLAAGFTLILQALARDVRRASLDESVLRAVGSTPREHLQYALLRGGLIAAGGLALAVVLATALSPVIPLGAARALEPHPGLRVDVPILLLGALMVLAVVTAAMLVFTDMRRRAQLRKRGVTPKATAGWRRSSSPTTTVGASFALGRPDRDAGASGLRSVLGLTIVVVVMVAATVFGANMRRFSSSPNRYGWRWDAMVTPIFATDAVREALAAEQSVDPPTEGWFGQLVVGDRSIPTVGLGHAGGTATVPIISGSAPVATDEVVLGRSTAHDLHTGVGATVQATTDHGPVRLKVVGIAVFPRLAPYQASEPTGLGVGAAMTLEGLMTIGPQNGIGPTFFLVHGRDTPIDVASLSAMVMTIDSAASISSQQRPVDVRGYDDMQAVPLLLVAIQGLLLVTALMHQLATGTRRRRRDLATLRALGFTTAQVRRTIAIQALLMLAIVLVVATPVGVVLGSWAWRLSAGGLGIADDVALPVVVLSAVLAIVVLMGIITSAIVGQRATRRPVGQSIAPE